MNTTKRRKALGWLRELTFVAAVLFVAASAVAQTAPAPPTDMQANDHPWDPGHQIDVTWTLSSDDKQLSEDDAASGAQKAVLYYDVTRSEESVGQYTSVGRYEPTKKDYERGRAKLTVPKCERDEPYYFKVYAVGPGGARSAAVGPSNAATAKRQIFDGGPMESGGRFWLAIIVFLICGSVIYWINHARLGKPLKVRKIAGLEAVDEAVGRATEMGRSCVFVPGIQDMNDIQTIAGITVLARVSKTAAEYDAKIEVPTSRALVMTTARETVQASFLAAGRPDAYNEDLIYYVTDEQFGYVAYLQGMMVREKPAACFYMGSFFAESLILAETGNSIGAIQVAGTAQPAQLPFFVAACDYTLIGEEFFAASAYLSGSPEELGSLKGQDVGKVIVAVLLLLGVFIATIAAIVGPESGLGESLTSLVDFLKNVVLT